MSCFSTLIRFGSCCRCCLAGYCFPADSGNSRSPKAGAGVAAEEVGTGSGTPRRSGRVLIIETRSRDIVMVIRNRMLVLPFFASLAMFCVTPNIVYASQFDKECASEFPNWHQYFERSDCVRRLKEQKALEDKKKWREDEIKRREEEARPCISEDLERMESLAKNIKDSINENMAFDEAREKIIEILGTDVYTQPTESDIKTWVVVAEIPTTCDTNFYFLVNVTAFQKGKVLRLGIWSKSAPKGYKSGYMTNFSTDFVKLRRDKAEAERKRRFIEKERKELGKKRRAAEAEKRRAKELERKRLAAEAENQRRVLEAEKRRAKELEKKRHASEAERKQTGNLPDPCAAGLSRDERLRRLRLSGKVRQTAENTFVAGRHRIVFVGGSLYSCR